MNMVRFGLRNLLRSKPRLAVVALLIGIPFLLLLTMRTIGEAVERQTALLRQSVDNTLQLRARGSMGHVNMVGNENILPQEALDKVRSIEHVAAAEPYLLAMTPTEGHNFAMVVGVNPGDTKRLESHGEAGSPRIIAGRDLAPADQGQRVALIGQGFATFAGIRAEDLGQATLTLDLKRTHPVIFALDRPPATLTIVGIYASGYVFGDMQLFVPLDTFREIYGVRDGISWLFVKADAADHLSVVERKLRGELGAVADIIAPVNVAEFQSSATHSVRRLSAGGVALSALLMVVVVFFVMLLIVRERSREIGTLKAIGASNAGIAAACVSEAIGFGAAGAALGALLFGAAGSALTRQVFGLGAAAFLPPQYKDTLATAMSLSADFGAGTLALLVATAVLAAVAGSAWGLRQALRLSPMEAIRHE